MKPGDGFLAVRFDPSRGFDFGVTADFADHDDAVGLGIVVEHLDHIEVRRAVDRIAANADAGGLADVLRRELKHRFVGQRAGARDHADVAPLVNITGRNADAAAAVGILRLYPALRYRGSSGPTSRVRLPSIARFTRTMSRTGIPSVIATATSRPASTPSRIASAANGGGTKIAETVAPVAFAASATELNIGTLCDPCSKNCPPFPGVTPATTFVP